MAIRQQILQDRRFHDLMPYRVREILLVSSPYDAFTLEEDGQLTEQVFFEYRDVSLSGPPRVTHVPTGEDALRLLHARRFDLILVMTSLADMGVNALGRRVKKLRPGRPVVLLALDRKELDLAQNRLDPKAVDGAFLWTGDSSILLAINKYIEDKHNVDVDIQHGNVRVIIMIEDSPRYYSSFLAMIYKELMTQSHSLYSEGVNELHRRMYMRSRPKILHATSFEDGTELFERYKENVIAVISDVGIPRDGVIDPTGGLDFTKYVWQFDPEMAVLLQSAEAENAEKAEAIGAAFVNKGSTSLLADIRSFFRRALGFGDFVFRLPDGQEVARARDVRELERQLAVVPDESIVYHASHNHFSIWLMARSEFELAERLRPREVSDFPSIEITREFLINLLRETQRTAHRGVISDFDRTHFDKNLFSRISQGSLGGKARSIAFLNLNLAMTDTRDFPGLKIKIPKTVVITTDKFDEFMDGNELRDFAYSSKDDREIAKRFVESRMDGDLRSDLTFIAHHIEGPLAVRSSSLLEDSMHLAMAGVYSTVMIPNNSRDPKVRLRDLSNAVKSVYASAFFQNAKSFLKSTGNRIEEEKMAVTIQRLVGRQHGRRFYPSFAGVAQSHNFYPIGPQRAEGGVVCLGLGLGRLVVEGGLALRFSPKHPGVLPQLATPKSIMEGTQRGFYALDMERELFDEDFDPYANVCFYDLQAAEEDGTLLPVGSVFSKDDQQLREDLSLPGPRIVTFNNILKHKAVPLADTLLAIIELTAQGLGCPVEIEFACDMGDWGRPLRPGRERGHPTLYLLQVRPFGAGSGDQDISKVSFEENQALCASDQSLGHGVEKDLRDLIYVRRDRWEAEHNKTIATEIGELNKQLGEKHPYVIIGPGRWGTADPWLGIPVQWSQISNVRVIVEASPEGYDVEPSQGTHFFQNITSLGVGYLTLPPGADPAQSDGDSYLDWEWLDQQKAANETKYLRHLRFDAPLTVVLDGQKGKAVIVKPRRDRR